jgi:hypothetical protein
MAPHCECDREKGDVHLRADEPRVVALELGGALPLDRSARPLSGATEAARGAEGGGVTCPLIGSGGALSFAALPAPAVRHRQVGTRAHACPSCDLPVPYLPPAPCGAWFCAGCCCEPPLEPFCRRLNRLR